ncbi:MAG: hypothetical protein IPP33_13965 [Flavobacteriales bacterium]|nr:hypothetical protein [Flavobacteriales bacterium]
MDEMLVKSRASATTLVDCQRFIKDAPILDEYITPKNRIGDLRKSRRN